MRKTVVLTALILGLLGGIGTKTAQARVDTPQAYRISMLTTAYCLRGTMASGKYVHSGAVAVDNDYWRFGTRFYIPGYGRGIARDTGSAIQGKARLDLWMASCRMAIIWGVRRKSVTVYR